MAAFPDLLRQTTAHCNCRGKQLSIGVLGFGTVSIILWILSWHVAVREVQWQFTTLFGPEGVARIEQRIEDMGDRPDVQAILDAFVAEIEVKPGTIPDDEKFGIMIDALAPAALAVLSAVAGLVIIVAFFSLWSWAFFLVLASGSEASWWLMTTQALRLLPKLLVLMVILICMIALWIPLVAVAVGIFLPPVVPFLLIVEVVFAAYIVPRLILSPMILVQDKTGVLAAIRRSLKLSRGRWLRIVGNAIGVSAIIWLGIFVARIFLNLLIHVALPFSSYAIYLDYIMTYILLVGTAYRTVFLMRLKTALSS